MQDEVTKHALKVYETMKRPGKNFWEKLREVTIEILIIVFAVTLSIWLHNWSDHRAQQKETADFLVGLKGDLTKDIQVIQENKQWYMGSDSDFRYLEMLISTNGIDTASDKSVRHYLNFAIRRTHPDIARYEGFKSSGKIGTIDEDSLKQEILSYYQLTMPLLNDQEDVANDFQSQLTAAELSKGESESFRQLAKSFKVQGLLELSRKNIDLAIVGYTGAQEQARKIIRMIEMHLKGKS